MKFPRFNNVYLDSAATTLKPESVIEAIAHFYRHCDGTVHRAIYSNSREATALYEGAREAVARFIHSSEVVIFTRGTTASLNLLARSLMPKRVVVTQTEHHSNIVHWQLVGAEVVPIPVDDRGVLILDDLDQLLAGADLLSVAHVANVTGTIHPIAELTRRAHRLGVLVAVDGAQAVGHFAVNVEELDVDFYAFSGHKMYGPTGIGVLYGKRALLEQMPPVDGGGDMVDRVSFTKSSYQEPPLKFEAGTPPIAEAIGLRAAIDFLNLSFELSSSYSEEVAPQILEFCGVEPHSLVAYATRRLLEIPGLTILGTAPHKGEIVSFVIEGTHPLDVATLLDCRGICLRSGHHCSQPTLERFGVSSCLRASFGLYNTEGDIDLLTEALHEIVPAVTR